jgi:predicted NBD/HSP70 family sugar kinase
VALVTVGVQAAISADGDHLFFTDTLPGWPELGARHRIADALGLEVELGNDVNLAAVAERAAGAAVDADSFALLWIGDGLGVAIDIGGTVHRGASGGAGEIGYHLPPPDTAEIEPDADDLTDFVGRGAFERIGRDLELYADRVAVAAAPVLAVLDPDLLVLGGPNGIEGGERLAALVAQRIEATSRLHCEVRTSAIASQPVLVGARRMLVHRIREHLSAGISPIPSP